MKRSKQFIVVTMLLGLIACLFSVPVLSGENPWDADGGNSGGTGTPADSLLYDAGMFASSPADHAPEQPQDEFDFLPGWVTNAMVKVSSIFLGYYYGWTSGPVQKNKYGI